MEPDGVQHPPAYLWVPEHVSSAGGEAADLAETVGMVADAEQRLVLNTILAETASGEWAAFEAAVIAARQNLKTWLFKVIAVADLWLFGTDLVVWSAHEFSTTAEAARDLFALAENYDHLRRHVKKVSRANGKESIELLNGSRINFRARTKTGGRGLTGRRVILDEAFALTADMVGTLMPLMSAVANPQILYGSSAGRSESAVLRTVRDRGRPGGDPSLAYIEWCCTRKCDSETAPNPQPCDHRVGTPGCRMDDPSAWAEANPAIDRRIKSSYIAKERGSSMPASEFGRERLGWWDDPDESEDGLPAEHWAACLDAESRRVGVPVFAAVVAHDLSWAAIAWAALRADGVPHVEVLDYRPGTEWVADRCRQLLESPGGALIVEAGGPKSSLSDDLDDADVEWVPAKSGDLVDACGVLEDRVKRHTVRHIGQPELDIAVKAARRRPVGDAWTWARRASYADVSPVVAVTLALWGLRNGADGPSVYESGGIAVVG